MLEMRANRFGVMLVAVLVVTGCSVGSAQPAASSPVNVNTIYDGLAGQEFVYNAAGTSGTFQRAFMDSLLGNFAKRTGMKVTIDGFCCGISKLAGMVDAGNVTWDAVEFGTITDGALAEANGLLTKLDPTVIPLDKLRDDSHNAYQFNFASYASLIVWNTDAFPLSGKHPTTIEDLFDTTTFPGRRCMSNYPQFGGTLEAAALASGVAPDKLYPLDIDRSLKELDKIKNNTLFWANAAQGIQALLTGSCKIGTMIQAPLREAIQQNPGAKLGFAWGHAIWAAVPLAIPKAARNLRASEALMKWFIEDRDGQAKLLERTTYTNVPLKDPIPIPADIAPYVLAGDNLKHSIAEDDYWYNRNIDSVLKKWNAWLVGAG
jgi:putative spermidine/putrescine transport system substrate-binding protein